MNNINTDYINQHDVIRRYLKGKLSAEETLEFEEYMLDKPELLEQLEIESVLVEHLPRATFKTVHTSSRWWYIFTGKPLWASLSTFALCTLGFSLLSVYHEQPLNVLQSQSIDVLYVSNIRGVDQTDASYSLSSLAETTLLILQPEDTESLSYQVTVRDHLNRTVVDTTNLRINNNGDLLLPVATKQLSVGKLKITLTNPNTLDKTQELIIEIVP
ncbi:MAG: hypothetical protein GW763_12760 [Paraglaciecola sp.]|nr:hypothetical protein [Paraglaciecola sp.]NCT48831.1 hypothetical protein [Paraglaciecola sp.]